MGVVFQFFHVFFIAAIPFFATVHHLEVLLLTYRIVLRRGLLDNTVHTYIYKKQQLFARKIREGFAF